MPTGRTVTQVTVTPSPVTRNKLTGRVFVCQVGDRVKTNVVKYMETSLATKKELMVWT